MDKPFGAPMIHTVTGSGYCIRAPGEAAAPMLTAACRIPNARGAAAM